MALTGDQYASVYLREEYIPAAQTTIFWNTAFLAPDSPFEIVQPNACPAGPSINQVYEYSTSTNSEAYVKGAQAPDPDTTSDVRAYFTKDFWHGSGKVYGSEVAQTVGAGGGLNVAINMAERSIDRSLKNMLDTASATFLTDLAAQVDSTTALGDGSLSRSTYSLASLETAHSAVLTAAVLEDTIENLQNTTYGVPDVPNEADLVWLMPRNQKTNTSRLNGGDTNYSMQWSAQSPEAIDGSRMHRTRSYGDVDIWVCPDMTTTEIYCVRKDACKIYMHAPVETEPKDVAEWAEFWYSHCGLNLVITNVRCAAKLTGVTA